MNIIKRRLILYVLLLLVVIPMLIFYQSTTTSTSFDDYSFIEKGLFLSFASGVILLGIWFIYGTVRSMVAIVKKLPLLFNIITGKHKHRATSSILLKSYLSNYLYGLTPGTDIADDENVTISMKRIYLITGLTLALLITALYLTNTGNYSYSETEVSFLDNNNNISGTLILPDNRTAPFPVVIFVHGDGAMPYDAYGHYPPLWNRLAKSGIASYSWDKAGTGNSTGNWLNQSMDDRADEVIAAIEMLKKHKDIIPNKIGLIGYSQAGWVLPLVSTKSDYPNFMVIVSGAINWMSQGNYLTVKQLTREGYSQTQIKAAVNYHESTSKVLTPASTYDDYSQFRKVNYPKILNDTSEPMTPDRFKFAKLNWKYDARKNLKDISSPTLAIFGDQDVNVDFSESARVYQQEFKKSGNNNLTVKVFSGAQHGLLKNEYFSDVSHGIWSAVKLDFLGDDAFIDGYLDYMAKWVEGRIEE